MEELENLGADFNLGNFNPDDVEVEETINVQFIVDTSYSVSGYVKELNEGFNEFVTRMQSSHVSEKLFVSIVEFNSSVSTRTGFQPISELSTIDFTDSINGTTALFAGVKYGLENALSYREALENNGVNCKTLVFIMTDGENNEAGSASDVKSIIDDLLTEERNFASFQTILFGINKGYESYFTAAAKDMGIKEVATISDSSDDIRNMISFISSSVTSGSGAVSTVNF